MDAKRRSSALSVCLAVGWAAVTASPATALEVSFATIADENTPIPRGFGNFTRFDQVAIDGGVVAFVGFGEGGQEGLYLFDGSQLSMVADRNTPVPGGTGTFTEIARRGEGLAGLASVRTLSLHDGEVAFVGGGPDGFGIYQTVGGALTTCVDDRMPVPGRSGWFAFDTGSFGPLTAISLEDGAVVFDAGVAELRPPRPFPVVQEAAIFECSQGNVGVVADTDTPPPAGMIGSFFGFDSPDVEGDQVVFSATLRSAPRPPFTLTSGLWVIDRVSGDVVFVDSTDVPGVGFLNVFDSVALEEGSVFFGGTRIIVVQGMIEVEAPGIYDNTQGEVQLAVPLGLPALLYAFSFSGGNVAYAFVAGASLFLPCEPLRVGLGGLVEVVVDASTVLDGRDGACPAFADEGFDGNRIAFAAGFEGGGAGVYVATLPLAVEIDIKPGNEINRVNPMSSGVIPVAILGSDTFDVADVDVTTLAFGPNGAPLAHRNGPHVKDANRDGFDDLLAHFLTEESGIAFGDTEACVTGELLDETPFEGCDTIVTLPPGCGDGFEMALLLPAVIWLHRRRRLAVA